LKLRRLAAQSFRNLAPLDLDTSAPFVVLHGPNAQGKTNALEAVHVLATLKALRGRRVRELVRFGDTSASVAGDVEHDGLTRQLRVDVGADGRKASLDGKPVHDLQEYFAWVRAIAFVPQDGEIVTGEPQRRRSWLDRAVFTATPAHLDRVRSVRRLLDQKAAALRGKTEPLVLDVLDERIAVEGGELVERRARLLAELRPHVEELHAQLAGGLGPLKLELASQAAGDSVAERVAALRERLAAARVRERERGTTLVGPQLDDVRILLEGRPAREFASRGQVRSVVLALKLAEMVAARARGLVPLFLLDDASTELDETRTAELVRLLGALGAQVLVTTTDPGPLTRILPRSDLLKIGVSAGVLGTPLRG
jgi:DNA replication and repair protein RecF